MVNGRLSQAKGIIEAAGISGGYTQTFRILTIQRFKGSKDSKDPKIQRIQRFKESKDQRIKTAVEPLDIRRSW